MEQNLAAVKLGRKFSTDPQEGAIIDNSIHHHISNLHFASNCQNFIKFLRNEVAPQSDSEEYDLEQFIYNRDCQHERYYPK
jgi:hypothetical protein